MKVKSESEVAQCLTLQDPMDCSLPGSSVHGIFPGTSTGVGAIAFSDVTGEFSCIPPLPFTTRFAWENFMLNFL